MRVDLRGHPSDRDAAWALIGDSDHLNRLADNPQLRMVMAPGEDGFPAVSGETLVIAPWRARAFPVIKDLVVDRSAFDTILAGGGFVSVLYARLAPGVPYNLVHYACGPTTVPIATFALSSAIGAPLVTPAWVKESVKALKALSPGSTPPGSIISRGSHHGRSHRGERPDGNGGARLFAGLALALSGDDGFHKQFGALLTHAGATVVDSNELIDDDEDEANRCDLVVVQESALERKGFKGSTLRRAAERHGVPCVWHPWAVESLLAGDQQGADGFLAVK